MVTLQKLAGALRIGDGESTPENPEYDILTRLLSVATELVERAAPGAPEDIRDEATVRTAGYLYDQPTAGRRGGYANAIANSGAGSLLLPWREHRAGSTGPSTTSTRSSSSSSSNGSGLDTDGVNALIAPWSRAGNSEQIPANKLLLAGGGGVSATADLLIERLGTLDGPILPANRVWLSTGVMIPESLHVLLLDAGQASDDYHVVDWDAVLMQAAGTAGTESAPGEFETFSGDAFTVLRIGHDADNGLLIANESTSAVTLQHIHVERLLAPLAVGTGTGTDQVARDAATAAQATAAQALQDDDVSAWALSDDDTPIPADKLSISPAGGGGATLTELVTAAAADSAVSGARRRWTLTVPDADLTAHASIRVLLSAGTLEVWSPDLRLPDPLASQLFTWCAWQGGSTTAINRVSCQIVNLPGANALLYVDAYPAAEAFGVAGNTTAATVYGVS